MPNILSVAPYDALLLVSFGGPEEPGDVIAFLENVTRGRGIPRERLAEVAAHYDSFGGRSPINDQCRALVAAIEADFAEHGVGVGVYWGNRNWDPYLSETVAQMKSDGIRRAAAFVTSAYSSYSGCRQYREDLYDAVQATPAAPRVDKLRHYYHHPGFISAFVDSTCQALAELPRAHRSAARIQFVTHSIPTVMAELAGPDGGAYVAQHRAAAEAIATGVRQRTATPHEFDLVYCSRSGPVAMPWLEPDVNDHLEKLADRGVEAVVAVPVGFVSDHMEVIYDLDTEAAETAKRLGIAFQRAATPGVHPAFVAVVRDLLVERAAVENGETVRRATVGSLPPTWDNCPAHCCPNLRASRPALCQEPA
ncbi:MAG: ferrochelatase [Propionibacteriales bacterium]|nr:ferrochelatase [Propionibacteriales bacterium]